MKFIQDKGKVMLSDYIESFEPYLQQLLQHRKSSQLKLIAAWDGLSTETQIKILSTVNYLPDEIKSKGIHSPNDYVRFLIADRFWFSHEDERKLLKKISEDKSIIVKFSKFPSQRLHVTEKNKEGHDISVLKPANFFAMSWEEQIFHFSGFRTRDGEEIAHIIEWGFNNQVNHEHLGNLIEELEDSFREDRSRDYDEDGLTEYLYARNLEALWRLIPKLGSTKPAKYLVWSLPTDGVFFNGKVLEDVIKTLPKKLIIDLFERKDFYWLDLRRKILSSSKAIYDDEIKSAAASKLNDPKILKVAKQEKQASKALLIRWGIFIFGLVCLFLDVPRWIAYICIGLPWISWIIDDIKQTINNKIDAIVNKVDKRFKKRLKKIKCI